MINAILDRTVEYVKQISKTLSLQQPVEERSLEIVRNPAVRAAFSGHSPKVVAATCVYAASILEKDRILQYEAADAIGVTEVAIRFNLPHISDTLGVDLRRMRLDALTRKQREKRQKILALLSDQPQSFQELYRQAEENHVSPTTLSQLLVTFEAEGLVTRDVDVEARPPKVRYIKRRV